MLVELRIANYRSINEEQIFSLVAGKDPKHPQNLIQAKGFKLLKAAAIYGSNAAGKSNLIKAVSFMDQLIANSATRMNDGDKIVDAVPFLLSSETMSAPCLIEATLVEEETAYRYGFTATQDRIHDEWLYTFTQDGVQQLWFERRLDLSTQQTNWTFDGPLTSTAAILEERTRDNSLVLSTGPRENVKPLRPVYQWFRSKLFILDPSYPLNFLKQWTATDCDKNPDLKRRITNMLRDADIPIDGFSVEHEDFRFPDKIPDVSETDIPSAINNLITAMRDAGQGAKRPRVRTQHHMTNSDRMVEFDMDEESNGTQRFFALAAPFLRALDTGSVLMIDELDASLHPSLTRKLIELFQSDSVNSRGAQLIFTTHDTTLLNPRLLRRDQIYLVEKDHNQGSVYFSLYDFDTKERPRDTEAFQRNYLSGRYGGVPRFGAIYEDLEIK